MEVGKIEYRVRPITRYIVTRYVAGDDMSPACSEVKGEYDSEQLAFEIGTALAKDEHRTRGWSLDDSRIVHPRRLGAAARDVEADELFQSERIAAALEVYQDRIDGADPSESEYEVRLFDAMRAAIQHADALAARR